MENDFHILVVEDDPRSRRSLADLLRPKCRLLTEGGSADALLSALQTEPAEIVFFDYDLPNTSGLELLKRGVEISPETYFVIISREPSDQLVQEALSHGARDFLRVPVRKKEVEEVFERWSTAVSHRKSGHPRIAEVGTSKLELKLPSTSDAILWARQETLRFVGQRLASDELRQLELVLDEALRNAYEHGNLGVSSAEKNALCEAGTFENELARRSAVAQAQGLEIQLLLELTKQLLRCTITDQGAGFDWRSVSEAALSPEGLMQPSGRGMYLMRRFFDRVDYNPAGNSVVLERRLRS